MILINDLKRKAALRRSALCKAVASVMDSGWYVLGNQVHEFEKAYGQYVGTEHCVSLANGTDALELALRAVGIVRGDKVATAANAGMYATSAILSIGGFPVFMDVDIETSCVTAAGVEQAVCSGAKAVIVTHLYGLLTPEIEDIADYCSRSGVFLIEDCAQAHGARLCDKKAGSFGAAASFSFYPTKNLGALGDGGAVTTNSDETAKHLRLLRQYGWTKKYQVDICGAKNSRLDEMQAAILAVFLPFLDTDNARRREIASFYNKSIKNPAVLTPGHEGEGYVAHLYVVRTRHRESLQRYLQQCGVGSDIHYPVPDHHQAIIRQKYSDVYLPNSEKLASEVLTLPCYPELEDTECQQLVEIINAFNYSL